jgi:hypothetical protein
VLEEVKRNFGVAPQSIEGVRDGRWVLLDYGGLIIHVFYDFVRREYNIEGYPDERFLQLVEAAKPDQVTLVPDDPSQGDRGRTHDGISVFESDTLL